MIKIPSHHTFFRRNSNNHQCRESSLRESSCEGKIPTDTLIIRKNERQKFTPSLTFREGKCQKVQEKKKRYGSSPVNKSIISESKLQKRGVTRDDFWKQRNSASKKSDFDTSYSRRLIPTGYQKRQKRMTQNRHGLQLIFSRYDNCTHRIYEQKQLDYAVAKIKGTLEHQLKRLMLYSN